MNNTTFNVTGIEMLDACNAARAHYFATGEGGDKVFYGVTVKLNALYLLMKQAEEAFWLQDTDETYIAFSAAQKTYYRAGGVDK